MNRFPVKAIKNDILRRIQKDSQFIVIFSYNREKTPNKKHLWYQIFDEKTERTFDAPANLFEVL